MKKFEYTIIDIKAPTKKGIISLLNKFAEIGWELISYSSFTFVDYEWQMTDGIFKRERNNF